MSYYAEIDQTAIEVGRKQQKGRCAAAYALANRYPDLRRISVDRDQVRFTDDYDRVRHCYKTPKNLAEFIDRWDKDEPVEPLKISFTRQNEVWKKPKKARGPRDLVAIREVNGDIPDHRPNRVPPRSLSIRPLKGQDPTPAEAPGPAFSG